MKTAIPIFILVALVATGCITPKGELVSLDADRILAVAAREIEAKCPEFIMQEFEPAWVYYHAGVNPRTDGTISVTYLSREPTDVRDWKSLTNGPPRTASSYRSAHIKLSDDGELQRQDVSEWPEFPEWVFVRFSEATLVTPKKENLSNQASQAIGAEAAPQPER